MHQEICAGKAPCADEQKFSSGTMQCRKSVPHTSHFRTIAPKIAPKVISPCSSSSYPPPLPDIAVSGVNTKPLMMPTQNYALMKVAGHEGTFSLVALPQVSPPTGTPVIQTTNKLPIPRYQSTRNKKLFDKKAKVSSLNVIGKTKSEKHSAQVIGDGHSESIPTLDSNEEVKVANHDLVKSTEEVEVDECCAVNPGSVLSSGTEIIKVNNPGLQYIDNFLHKPFCASGHLKVGVDGEKASSTVENGMLARCENTKAGDPANSMTVISPVVFGNPVHLIPSIPKGKLPILPYSKIKKSIISKCKQSVGAAKVPALSVKEYPSGKSSFSQAPLGIGNVSAPSSQHRTGIKPEAGKLNGVLGKRRGRKRKGSNENAAYQTKMKLGNKLLVCKDKVKMQVLDASAKKTVSTKKYRSIMPKPVLEIQSLASLDSSTSLLQFQTADSGIRNKLFQLRPNRWKQIDGLPMKQSFDGKSMSLAAKACYKCHICDHIFQLKHHLQDHLNTHTNRRPYHCRLCRKAYVHSGSLSTHMKLHHSENRLKKLMCCEFCAKVFGHIRVYFGHLKEVHRVIISTETSTKKDMNLKMKEEGDLAEREKSYSNEDDSSPGQTEEIKLEIKCGRCQTITPTFLDMKLHLFCEHGEEFQERLQEGILESRQGAQEEVVKHATHHWKLLNERRSIVKCSSCEEEFFGSSKLKKHICVIRQNYMDTESTQSSEMQEDIRSDDHNLPISNAEVQLWCGSQLNCILCKQVFELKEELLSHWQQWHHCEEPSVLWTVFCSLSQNNKGY
ncbi:zinc finger protein 438 [Discoglossus pictus]